MDRRVARVALLLGVMAWAAGAAAGDPSPLVSGLRSVCALEWPGPVWALRRDVVPVVGADDDATPPGLALVVAVEVGQGRVVAYGHEQLFNNRSLGVRDHGRLADNMVDWLVGSGPRAILATTGHQEWWGESGFEGFQARCESRGYAVSRRPEPLTRAALRGVGVLVIGNAWGPVTAAEIGAVEGFVRNGGGLLLGGLGWSWKTYQGPLDAYPMNQIGERFGIAWVDGSFSDPSHNYQGSPVFRQFYPEVTLATPYQAFVYIDAETAGRGAGLPAALEAQPALRARYNQAHQLLATASRDLSSGSTQRRELYAFQRRLVTGYPQLFAKSVRHDPESRSAMARARERTYITFADALPLTTARKTEIGDAMGLRGRYRDIWERFGILLVDNGGLDAAQKEFFYRYLDALPPGLHDLRRIAVSDLLGQPGLNPMAGDLDGLSGRGAGINLWGGRIGEYSGNPFPADVPPVPDDAFCGTAAHEVTHVVDAFTVEQRARLRTRRSQLLGAAGRTPMNFLRSMFGRGFFADNPAEFLASIGNQWFADSRQALKLGLVRFDHDWRHPINQALFFSEMLSRGGSTTSFYRIDTQGHVQRTVAPVRRDSRGRIVGLTVGGTAYGFALDNDGNVTDYYLSAARAPGVVSGLTAVPTPGGAEVVFTLSGAATIEAGVLNLAGRPVRTVARGREGQTGTNRLLWDGKTEDGLRAPAGRYLVRVRARAEGGESSVAVAPVVLSR